LAVVVVGGIGVVIDVETTAAVPRPTTPPTGVSNGRGDERGDEDNDVDNMEDW
jgi:hypothetical protein